MNRPTYSSVLRVIARLLIRAGVARAFAADGVSLVRVDSDLPGWLPNSSGSFRDRAAIAVTAIATAPQSMLAVAAHPSRVYSTNEFITEFGEGSGSDLLASLFNLHGSDKASTHDYYRIYATILSGLKAPRTVLEIGLGTNNTDVLSNMGSSGRPGASLRAFRDFCPDAFVFGADIDERILFSEQRIKTLALDQLDPNAWAGLRESIGSGVDLLIDDGLHAFSANMSSIQHGLPMVRAGGWLVIEDIDPRLCDMWSLLMPLLGPEYRAFQVKCKAANLFAIKRADK